MAKIFEARWLGAASERRDGPERRIFKRGIWVTVSPEEAAYFKQFKTWEVREQILQNVPLEPVLAPKPQRKKRTYTRKRGGLGGSAILAESEDQGYVAMQQNREVGSKSEPVIGEVI